MRKIITLVLMLLVIPSCLQRDFNEIKEIPLQDSEKSYTVLDRNDIAYHFGYQRGHNSTPIKVPTNVRFLLLDSRYEVVDYFYFRKFNSWFKELVFQNGIMPINQNETIDCDNFAMLYKAMWSVAAYSNKNIMEFAVGLVTVQQVNEFGGIPSGALHMLNIVFCNKNWYIFEPQTGEFIELDKYPNQEYIINIIL